MSRRVEDPAVTSTRRKRIVGLLEELDTPVTVDQLVDELEARSAWRPDRPGESTTWETLHERLFEEDLPALERAGLLNFHDEHGLVTECGEAVPVYREARPDADAEADDEDRHVGRYFVVLGVVALAALAAATFDVGPFVRVPDVALATALLVVSSLLSLVSAVWE